MSLKPAFHVGVVGHRELAEDVAAAIEATAARILRDIEVAVAGLSGGGREKADSPVLVSALAEGADRIGARLALKRDWRLLVPLPFSRTTYEQDFPDSIGDFRDLLAAASARGEIVELRGSREAPEEAYLAVGRFVLHNSQLLVAIWDGEPARGVGGTAEIVAEAVDRGIPIIHIEADSPHRVTLVWGTQTASPLDYSAELLTSAVAGLAFPMLPDIG